MTKAEVQAHYATAYAIPPEWADAHYALLTTRREDWAPELQAKMASLPEPFAMGDIAACVADWLTEIGGPSGIPTSAKAKGAGA